MRETPPAKTTSEVTTIHWLKVPPSVQTTMTGTTMTTSAITSKICSKSDVVAAYRASKPALRFNAHALTTMDDR